MIEREKIIVNLKELKAPEKNVRMHPEKQIKEIIKSLDKFGQYRDIVIDENNTVLAGNGLLEAMLMRGDTIANAVRLVGLSEKEKYKFMLADNKTFSLGVDDLEAINDVIASLGDDLDVPGYDEETLKMIVAAAEDVTEKIMKYGTIDESQIDTIKAKGEHREKYMENAEKFQESQQDNDTDNIYYEELRNISANTDNVDNLYAQGADSEQLSEIRKSVFCPKCGERIWL